MLQNIKRHWRAATVSLVAMVAANASLAQEAVFVLPLSEVGVPSYNVIAQGNSNTGA